MVAPLASSARKLPDSQPAKAPRPSEVVDQASCVTAQCHANLKAFKVQHTPVAMNNCDTCHELADASKHTFTYPRHNQEMCTYCHEFDVSNIPVVHTPVNKGECTGCHDPHGGTDNRLFRENSLKELCFRCHEDVTTADKHVHKPFADGQCDSCHASHASRFPKLLYAEGDALCLSCHDKFADALTSVKFVHKGMKEGCSRCHPSHSAPYEKQLRQPIATLCTETCHEDVKKQATFAKYKHSAVLKDRACLTCHAAHGSNLAGLMARPPIEVCMSCHDQSVQTDRGYVVAALPELKDPKTTKHGPINDGLCEACHQSHGSNEALLLAATNSNKFYQPLGPANYKLCFTCHDIRLATQERTTTATAFRNGNENLHFVHVNDGGRGRNCRVCHNTHASMSPKHVNTVVQYGKWKMPVDFVKTETGGSCTRSCHPPYRYDRERPVAQPTTRPTTRPTSAPILVAARRPEAATFTTSLIAINGQVLAVPRADRPTVLIFIHPAHPQQDQLFKEVAAAVPSGSLGQVILIVGGDKAMEQAKQLARTTPPTFAVVADESNVSFDRLEVNVWPTVVVLRRDGTQAWRSAGVSDTLWMTLSAYVEFAAANIDHATLVQRLAIAQAVRDSSSDSAQRQLTAARRMLDAQEPEAARKLLEQAVNTHPTAFELRAQLARAYVQLNQPEAAIKQLDMMPPNSIAPDQEQLLRARAMIEEMRWSEAQQALTSLTTRYPNLSEPHFLLGQLYERDQRWQDAAREYKLAHEHSGSP